MQENKEIIQAPIAFMRMSLKNQELRYSQMEKHAYVVVRALNKTKFYILYSHSMIHVSNSVVKSILTQQDFGCNNRGAWIAKVQEYDIEIKPTKLVRGNALCRALVEDQQVEEEDTPKVFMVRLQDPWFSNIAYFLTYGDYPDGLTAKKRRDLKKRS